MKLYKVEYYGAADGHQGFEWYQSKEMAEVKARDGGGEIEEVEIKLTKRGVLGLLRVHAVHPDNG